MPIISHGSRRQSHGNTTSRCPSYPRNATFPARDLLHRLLSAFTGTHQPEIGQWEHRRGAHCLGCLRGGWLDSASCRPEMPGFRDLQTGVPLGRRWTGTDFRQSVLPWHDFPTLKALSRTLECREQPLCSLCAAASGSFGHDKRTVLRGGLTNPCGPGKRGIREPLPRPSRQPR